MISSKEVAMLAGVSQATVSRVARGSASVSSATRDHVLSIFAQTGYRSNASNVLAPTRRLILQLPSLYEADTRLLDYLFKAATEIRYQVSVSLLSHPSASPGLSKPEGLREYAGTLVIGDGQDLHQFQLDPDIPTLIIGTETGKVDVDTVFFDDYGSAQKIAADFANAGYQRVALVGKIRTNQHYTAQARGFRLGAQKHDLSLTRSHVIDCSNNYESAYHAACQMLGHGGELPHAIYCTSDQCAIGVIEAARRLGLHVPQDLWVVGYGNTDIAEFSPYLLTSVSPPFETLAKFAINRLIERIGNRLLPTIAHAMDNTVCVRNTTGQIAVKDESEPR